MSTDDTTASHETAMDHAMADIHQELVRQVTKRNQDEQRDIYDALGDE